MRRPRSTQLKKLIDNLRMWNEIHASSTSNIRTRIQGKHNSQWTYHP